MERESGKQGSRRPKDDPFRQQKMKMWQPIMTPFKVVAIFIAIGICFVPAGVSLLASSNAIYEASTVYDGTSSASSCSITRANQGKSCQLSFTLSQDVTGPLYVYYALTNYYQNHRKYIISRSASQLEGTAGLSASVLQTGGCTSMLYNGSKILSPCGLIANSFFTDVISLTSSSGSSSSYSMDETGISWSTDSAKFIQPSAFQSAKVANDQTSCASSGLASGCKKYLDQANNQWYNYIYPDESTTQYLYETYPLQISPIDGVTNEHFKVWMRTAALPSFRKLYGRISGNFKKGDVLTFTVLANYEVASFSGSKALVISSLGEFGGKNPYLGVAYIVVGSLSLLFGFLFGLKQVISPRPIGNTDLLPWQHSN